MIAMGLPNVRQFPFIESPDENYIEQTILNLKQHVCLLLSVLPRKYFEINFLSTECFNSR